jgi:DNA (cytosine-5)-methyltransferase 1
VTAYYNEIDPFAAEWLRSLIAAGHIAPGDVDDRSITDVRAADLVGYTQCHFFAGIGGWSLALRLAGVPDDYPVWTGSCPCQGLSVAGKLGMRTDDWQRLRAGHPDPVTDRRHLWPHFHRLITERSPAVVFGEQTASADGRTWLSAVQADMEDLGYGVGAADLCAAGVGAPHWRQRLWWGAVRVADADRERRDRLDPLLRPDAAGREPRSVPQAARGGAAHGLANPDDARPQGRVIGRDGAAQRAVGSGVLGCEGRGATHGGWRDVDWLGCRDGKWRPVEPGSSPLVDGVPARVGRLRGYGNAIVPQVAAAFVTSFLGAAGES